MALLPGLEDLDAEGVAVRREVGEGAGVDGRGDVILGEVGVDFGRGAEGRGWWGFGGGRRAGGGVAGCGGRRRGGFLGEFVIWGFAFVGGVGAGGVGAGRVGRRRRGDAGIWSLEGNACAGCARP